MSFSHWMFAQQRRGCLHGGMVFHTVRSPKLFTVHCERGWVPCDLECQAVYLMSYPCGFKMLALRHISSDMEWQPPEIQWNFQSFYAKCWMWELSLKAVSASSPVMSNRHCWDQWVVESYGHNVFFLGKVVGPFCLPFSANNCESPLSFPHSPAVTNGSSITPLSGAWPEEWFLSAQLHFLQFTL